MKSRAFGRQLYIDHFRDFGREREFVNHQKLKSQKPEEEIFFVEVDGIDQSKTLRPQYVNAPKNVDKDLLFNFHITTVK